MILLVTNFSQAKGADEASEARASERALSRVKRKRGSAK
jgi:hypothetical protein